MYINVKITLKFVTFFCSLTAWHLKKYIACYTIKITESYFISRNLATRSGKIKQIYIFVIVIGEVEVVDKFLSNSVAQSVHNIHCEKGHSLAETSKC